jgi:hypothetical protein
VLVRESLNVLAFLALVMVVKRKLDEDAPKWK